jgi:dihydrolipoamide dehydrogenase
MSDNFDLIVIGAGPGGYVAAIRAAQLGFKTACVEKDATLGGTCLNVGCIPSKAMLESSEKFDELRHLEQHGISVESSRFDLAKMLARKDKIVKQLTGGIAHLFKKNKIARFEGLGTLAGNGQVTVSASDGSTQTLSAKHILVATGSTPTNLPGVEMDYDVIGTSTEALSYPQVPEHLVVIGAGVIGLELGSVWARLGAKVTVLEYMPTFLPFLDAEFGKLGQKLFKRQGIDFKFGVKVTGAQKTADGARVEFENPEGGLESVSCDRVLVAVGRKPNTQGLGVEAAAVQLDRRGRIEVDDHFKTSAPGVWAIGDVIRGPMLAHKAEDEGVAVAEIMAGLPGHVNYDAIPGVVYTHPEIANVGKTEAECKEAGIPVKVGSFPFVANGRAKALGQTDGMVKIVAHADTDRILGAQVLGPRAGGLIAELVVAMEFSASAEDIARSVHAHPTLAEVVKEAALAVGGRVIHM